MRGISISWPKLLGTLLVIESLSLILLQASLCFGRLGSASNPITIADGLGSGVVLLFFVASCFVYRGREWARLAVVITGTCAALVFCWARASASIATWGDYAPQSGRPPSQIFESFAGELGFPIAMFVGPMAFIICTLCHRDVVAAFRTETQNGSNRAIQRTAARSDA